jgi:hypothetical protein
MASRITEFIKQYWIIFLLLPISILFFLFGPKLIASLFVDEGKPIQEDVEIPEDINDGQYKYAIDYLSIYEENFDLYNLAGWVFSTKDKNISSSEYEAEFILYNDSGNYLFSSRSSERADVVEHFSDLNLNIEMPGFSVLINKNLINKREYCIGILLTNQENNSQQFIQTNQIISNTPNTFSLSKANELMCELSKPEAVPLLEDITLNEPTREGKYSIDSIRILDEESNIFCLSGWAFLTINPSEISNIFKTEVVLVNSSKNYLLETIPKSRQDVIDYFSDLYTNIRMPGFSACIDKTAFFNDNFCIVLKLTNSKDNSNYFINTNKVVIISEEDIQLIDEINPECEEIYYSNMDQDSN